MRRTGKPGGFREEFPFLDSPSCPVELEALASRKFTRYRAYVGLHRELFGCSSLAECADVAGRIVANYIENRMIYEELAYYKEHRSLLGRHPIFATFRMKRNMMAMDIRELVRLERRLLNNIWRAKSEMAKGDRPHLDIERKSRMREYEAQLAEVRRLLGRPEEDREAGGVNHEPEILPPGGPLRRTGGGA